MDSCKQQIFLPIAPSSRSGRPSEYDEHVSPKKAKVSETLIFLQLTLHQDGWLGNLEDEVKQKARGQKQPLQQQCKQKDHQIYQLCLHIEDQQQQQQRNFSNSEQSQSRLCQTNGNL